MNDKLLIDRATIAQALEALELRCGTNAEEREPNGAITALRAALAQEQAGAWQDGVLEGHLRKRERWLAQEPEPVQEPACSCSLRGRLVGDGCEVCNPELAAELRQQPEPVQEPVAWMWKERVNGDFDSAWRVTRCEPPPYAIEQQPLYTAPTPRKPETEQEPVESALQAVAEKIGDQCAVWYGIGARDVEEVLREAARHGLVHGALAESETTCRRAICQRGPDGYCAPCHERMYP